MALEPHHFRFVSILPREPAEAALRQALQAVVKATAMTPFGPERVSVRDDAWDAIQMIAESHIGLHGHGRSAEANVWSCKPFDPELAASALDEALGGVWYYRRVSHGGYEEP